MSATAERDARRRMSPPGQPQCARPQCATMSDASAATRAVSAAVMVACVALSRRRRREGVGAGARRRKRREESAPWRTRDEGRRRRRARAVKPTREHVLSAIGNTPVMRVESLSRLTRCDIYVKCEFLNPGGSVEGPRGSANRRGRLSQWRAATRRVVHRRYRGEHGSIARHGVQSDGGGMFRRHARTTPRRRNRRSSRRTAPRVERVRPVSIANRGHFVNVARREAERARARGRRGRRGTLQISLRI